MYSLDQTNSVYSVLFEDLELELKLDLRFSLPPYSNINLQVVAYGILVSAPVPFGSIWVLNWVGLGWDWAWWDWGRGGLGFGTKA